MIYEKITDLIGNTPVVKYATINGNDIYLKLEMFNPAGSIKDRVAYQMVKELIDAGKINKDTKIVEATSGNTGIGLALVLGCMGLHPYIFYPQICLKSASICLRHTVQKLCSLILNLA